MTPEQAAALREAFPPSAVGKLPRKTKSGGVVHLDYVGHAAVTDRLLKVDPEWSWEPMAVDEAGNPVLTRDPELGAFGEPIGLWIVLTVAGVRRPGYGGGKNVKEAISDAIRNAAMRFGVALDLWAKEPLGDEETTHEDAVTRGALDYNRLTQLMEGVSKAIAWGPYLQQYLEAVHGVERSDQLSAKDRKRFQANLETALDALAKYGDLEPNAAEVAREFGAAFGTEIMPEYREEYQQKDG